MKHDFNISARITRPMAELFKRIKEEEDILPATVLREIIEFYFEGKEEFPNIRKYRKLPAIQSESNVRQARSREKAA